MSIWKYLLKTLLFSSFGYRPISGIARSYGHSVFVFLCFCALPYSFPQQVHHLKFPSLVHKDFNFFTFLPTFVIFCIFFRNSHPTGIKLYIIVLLICISHGKECRDHGLEPEDEANVWKAEPLKQIETRFLVILTVEARLRFACNSLYDLNFHFMLVS